MTPWKGRKTLNFSEKIYKQICKSNVLEIGEVKTHQAYLYSEKYEMVFRTLQNRKVLELTVLSQQERTIVLSKVGTLNHLLRVATGYAIHH